MKSVHDICRHRWTELLPHVGIDPKYLTGKHTPCPVCGGKDRFRYLNTEGKGGAICNQCGGFNPVDLVMQVTGRDFQEAARELEKLAGSVEPEKPRKARDNAKCREASSALWKGSEALTGDDPVSRYLEARGIDWRFADGDIRYHPSCSY
ncbi:MAG: hypothetical protein JJ979_27290, partial [Roseibium sp.]|nr:hypothetical protein [Roseibium sp.]